MYKRVIILLLFIFSANLSIGQFLHIGARGFFTPVILMDYYDYDVTDYVYYFSNERNETLRFSGFELSTITSFTPSLDLYFRYDIGNHIFFQLDVFSMKFENKAKYRNSIDYNDFVEEFNPDGTIEDLEYNTIKLRWKFTGNSLSIGYKFLKAKRLRPFIFTGLTSMYLMNFEHRSVIDQTRARLDANYVSTYRHYNNIVFKNLDTFKQITFHTHFGFGFKFHGITFDIYATNSLPNKDIDIYADNYYSDSNAYNGDISLSERANYKSMYTFNTSLSVNLLSFNLSKKHLQY